ncbi:unnamed protein product [Pseudo-nitzschia multistriata]|uniref:DUF6824 domain-containing protein n=1 Tax=Pseudo-nitzschia multistriata TaxID=183589 RepID=A0A448YYI8_9STRA|nr:unnamed protein product [Pseudo-nitzschia multistriata]
MLNRKRQRRQAAAVIVESLWSNGGKNTSNNGGSNTKTSSTPTRKSTAQPRPAYNIPPKGIGPISEPNENDVLCGRGGRINSHAGNVQFRNVIHSMKKEYLAPTTKKLEKAHIAARIVNDIRSMNPPGRFLKEEKSDGMWYDIGDKKAIKKTGQALREDAPGIRPVIDADAESSGDEKKPCVTKVADSNVAKSRGLSPNMIQRGNAIQDNTVNLSLEDARSIWPQQHLNNNTSNIQQSMSDYHAQSSMPPPFRPNRNNNNAFSTSYPVGYSMHQEQNFMQNNGLQNQQGFQTRNIQLPQGALPNQTSFSNQLYPGVQSTTNNGNMVSRRMMDAMSQPSPPVRQQQQYNAFPRQGGWQNQDIAFDRTFHEPNRMMGDDNTLSTISGLSEVISSNMGSANNPTSSLMNMSLRSNFSLTGSLRRNSMRGGNSIRTYDSIGAGGPGINGSIRSGFAPSLARSNSFSDISSIMKGSDNWKEEGNLNLLEESDGRDRDWGRNSSAMSIGTLIDMQSNASSTQLLAAAVPGQDDRSFMSSAMMMSTELDALDLAF